MLAACLCLSAAAHADPGYYVVTTYDNSGVRLADFRYWSVKRNGRSEVIWPEIGFGYGVTSRWTTELFLSGEGGPRRATRLSSVNWQNDVLLTQGEWPLDVALHAQIIRERADASATTLEWGPVLQTDVGRTQVNFNVFFDRSVSGPDPSPVQMKYQWQVRHRWGPTLHFGAQGFGELGHWDEWSPRQSQSHRAGPAVFSSVRVNGQEAMKFQAAWLMGSTYGRAGRMITLKSTLQF
jgi:hypothetical protein